MKSKIELIQTSLNSSRNAIINKMYVSNIENRLREMETPSDIDCQRWPWELMQNAKDSIVGTTQSVVDIDIIQNEDQVIFRHNGAPFNSDSYYGLMYKFSEGKNNTESTGRFGTGFLTTHSLSKIVHVEGDIQDNDLIVGFQATMYRDGKDHNQLLEGLRRYEEEQKLFNNPFGKTTFTYDLITKRNHESSKLGADNFEKNLVLTMLFNDKFGLVKFSDWKGKEVTTRHVETKNIDGFLRIEHFQVSNKGIRDRYFLVGTIDEPSQLLTEHFSKERNLKLEGCIELIQNQDGETYSLTFNPESPSIFCSLPLVGSEKHVLPIILNSNDFEPSTERQEIILDQVQSFSVRANQYILQKSFEIYERIVQYCSSHHFLKLYILIRGINSVPTVKKYFYENWYLENYMKPLRTIFMKYEVVLTEDGLKKIEDVYFPIYLKNDENYTKEFYKFVKELYKIVPTYEESLKWSKMLWNVPDHLITYNVIFKNFSKTPLKNINNFINSFIKFAWDYHKNEIMEIPVLINQNGEFVKYTDEFATSIGVPKELGECLDHLGCNWKAKHLHPDVTSIKLPLNHDSNDVFSMIRNQTKNDIENSLKFTQYVIKGDKKRELVYHYAHILFPNIVIEKIELNNVEADIWDAADSNTFLEIIKKISEMRLLNNINRITYFDHREFLKFISNYCPISDVFNKYKLIPNYLGELKLKNELYSFEKIPMSLVSILKDSFGYKLESIVLHPDFYDSKIQLYNTSYEMKLIAQKINQHFERIENTPVYQYNGVRGFEDAKKLINYIPLKESNEDAYEYQMELFNNLNVFNIEISNPVYIEYCPDFYKNINKIIIQWIVRRISDCQNLLALKRFCNEPIKYIDKIIKAYDVDCSKYPIIPNQKGNFNLISNLYFDDNINQKLKEDISPYFNILQLLMDKRINQKPLKTIKNDDLIGICDKKILSKNPSFAYKIIKYVSKDEETCKKQKIFLDVIQKFDVDIDNLETIQIQSSFWNLSHQIIIRDLLEKIKRCRTIFDLTSNILFNSLDERQKNELIDKNIEKLEAFYSYLKPSSFKNEKIIVNQNNYFISFSEAYCGADIPEKFKDLMIEDFNLDLRNSLINEKYKTFEVNRLYSIEDCTQSILNKFKSPPINDKIATDFLHFMPENHSEDDCIHEFIKCYQFFMKTKFEIITIKTPIVDLWTKPIQIVAKKIIISFIEKYSTLDDLAKTINQSVEDTVNTLNQLLLICKKKDINTSPYKVFPNQINELVHKNNIFDGSEIDPNLIDIIVNLDQKNDYRKKLVHPSIQHQEIQKINTPQICKNIDGLIHVIMKNESDKADPAKKLAIKNLILTWLPKHREFIEHFPHVTKKKLDAIVEFCLDPENYETIKSKMRDSPEDIVALLSGDHNIFTGGLSLDHNIFTGGLNLDINSQPTDSFIGYEAEAYVYEILIKSKLFQKVIWPALINSPFTYPGKKIKSLSGKDYYVQQTQSPYDIMAVKNGIKYYFEVKSTGNYSKFQFKLSNGQIDTLSDFKGNDKHFLVLVFRCTGQIPKVLFLESVNIK